MAQRKFYVSGGPKAEVLVTAFYRFLEIHSRTTVDDDGLCSIRSEFDGPLEVKVLSFWSERAASEFVLFWDDFYRVYGRPEEARLAAAASRTSLKRKKPSRSAGAIRSKSPA